MPYILLVIGLLIGAIFLFRFFTSADKKEVKAAIYTVFTITICVALFILAVTGRLPAAIAIVAAAWPFLAYWWQKRNQVPKWEGKERGGRKKNEEKEDFSENIEKKEALDILGLSEGATEKEIKAAHRKLMQKLHPDTGGSEGLARRLNKARDILLNKK